MARAEGPGQRDSKFRTPHVVTIITGVVVAVAAAFFPVSQLADYSNSGTLFAFGAVSLGVMILRFTDKSRPRPIRATQQFTVAPCRSSVPGVFLSLGIQSKLLFFVWTAIGVVLYFCFGFWNSNIRRGIVDVVELDDSATGQPPASIDTAAKQPLRRRFRST